MESRAVLKVVVASPGDVTEEREAVAGVVAELNRMFRDVKPQVHLDVIRWETDAHPGLHSEGPQGLIDERLDIARCDILIGVFSRRFGTPARGAASGTEHEIRTAIDAWKKTGAPQVMLYFQTIDKSTLAPEECEQWGRVQDLKHYAGVELNALWWSYRELSDFQNCIRGHLFSVALQISRTAFGASEARLQCLRVTWEPELVMVRSEGYTELLGNWYLRCRSTDGFAAGNTILSLLIFLNAPITSRPSEPLVVECGRSGGSILPCSLIQSNYALFLRIDLGSMRSGEERQLQVSNLRCSPMGAVRGLIGIPGAICEGDAKDVATMRDGLVFEVLKPDGTRRTQIPTLPQGAQRPPEAVAVVRFTEGFPGAFKPRFAAGVAAHSGALVHLGESGAFGILSESDDGALRSTAAADSGTRLRIQFASVPRGVRILVPTTSMPGVQGGVARLVAHSSTLLQLRGTPAYAPDLIELNCLDGTAAAVWEVTSTGQADQHASVNFAIYVAYDGWPTRNLPNPGSASIVGEFAPVMPFPTASATSNSELPVPRFKHATNSTALFTVTV